MLDSVRNSLLSFVWRNVASRNSQIDHVGSLRSLLRRYPRWVDGHRNLAERYLEADDIAHAYPSCLCLKELVRDDSQLSAHASLLLGRCFLKRGDWQTALTHLESARAALPNSGEVLEELAAAQMLAGNYPQAVAALNSIPSAQRSPQAKAALIFAQTKLS